MKSDSELMNELAHRTNYLRELTQEESDALKLQLLNIYKDIASLCEKEGLTFMLSGGSCLGAIRHKGFIPWDDDLDIMMPRKDYDRLIELCKNGVLGDKYEYNFPDPQLDCKNVFLKIYRKNSINLDLFSESGPFPKGIAIDVFCIDGVPRIEIMRKIKGFFANVLQYISILILYAQYPSKSLQDYMALDKSLNRRYKAKKTLGKLFGIIPHRKWVYWFDKFVSDADDQHYVGIPTGRKYYNGEIFPANVYFPPTKVTFCNEEVYVPNDYHQYLTNLYKNYMELPPIEKRERHFICDFQLPND